MRFGGEMRAVLVFVAMLVVAGPAAWFAGQPGGLPRVTVLPTPDGPTYLIEDGAGRRVLLGGGEQNAALAAFADRTPPWDRRVDALVLPPPFVAHLPGATEIVRRAGVRRVIELGGPGQKPPQRYDPWQLATLDRGRVPERLWGHAALPLAGATLDLVAPTAPDGVPLRLPTRAPKPDSTTRAKPTGPATSEADAAPGAYARLSNGRATVLLALGTPGEAVPGFARLRGPAFLVASPSPALPALVVATQPHALLTFADAAAPDPAVAHPHALVVPRGVAVTLRLDGDAVRVEGVANLPAWVSGKR